MPNTGSAVRAQQQALAPVGMLTTDTCLRGATSTLRGAHAGAATCSPPAPCCRGRQQPARLPPAHRPHAPCSQPIGDAYAASATNEMSAAGGARPAFAVTMETKQPLCAQGHGAASGAVGAESTPRGGPGAPGRRVTPTVHMPPMLSEEKLPCMAGIQNDVLLPAVPMEKPQCHREILMATTKMPQKMSASDELPAKVLPAVPSTVPPAEAERDSCGIELPIVVPVLPTSLKTSAEQASQSLLPGSCLIHNWQNERSTNHLDTVPVLEPGNKGFTHLHGHHGLLVHELLSWPTMKDTYHPPHRALLLGRGQRQAMLESMLYQKYRNEMLEEICPHQMPMESVSTTHQDYRAEGCQLTPLPTTKPHNYCTEQPFSFWLEKAHSLPGVTKICSRDSPFRRNAAFSTPITECLEQPLSYTPWSSQLQPHKQ
ncbi:sperm-associated antigen 8 [Pogoniulus pusillus]|uniref:sperm-associated antigen 8 n=1 Tax=Pogoniulus pusillus TaxID=488313 RepID=UPI0030B98F70